MDERWHLLLWQVILDSHAREENFMSSPARAHRIVLTGGACGAETGYTTTSIAAGSLREERSE